jgi:hypothetical protein
MEKHSFGKKAAQMTMRIMQRRKHEEEAQFSKSGIITER